MADRELSDDLSASERAYRGAALQALTSLGHVSETIRREMVDLSKTLEQATTPDVMLADPDSPVNIMETLTVTRAEVIAARAALQPFARAYLRKMEQLGDVSVEVFRDPQRPEHNRFIKLSDLREAARVFASMSIGIETLSHLRRLEQFVADTAVILETFAENSADRLSGEERHVLLNMLTMAKAIVSKKSL
jgi:hypothetical protein